MNQNNIHIFMLLTVREWNTNYNNAIKWYFSKSVIIC